MTPQEFSVKFPLWDQFLQSFSQELTWDIARAPNARCLGVFCEKSQEWETFRLGIDNSIQQSPQLELARNEVIFAFSSPLFQWEQGFEVTREIVGYVSEDQGEVLQDVLGTALKQSVNLYDLSSREVLRLHLPVDFQRGGVAEEELLQAFERWSEFWKSRAPGVLKTPSWRMLWNPASTGLTIEIRLSALM